GAVDLGAAASGAAGGGDGCWAEATDSGETASTTENTVTAILNPVIGLTSARLRRQLTQMLREFGNVKANRREGAQRAPRQRQLSHIFRRGARAHAVCPGGERGPRGRGPQKMRSIFWGAPH